MDSQELNAVMAMADSNPTDVEAQIAAAYGNDRYGQEQEAVGYYEAAWNIGVPSEMRCRFLVGYGSTLRNVGRLEESIAIHRLAISEYPEFPAHHAFLALALHDVGEHDEAMAEALTALVDSGASNLDGYDRALSEYRDLLLTPPAGN